MFLATRNTVVLYDGYESALQSIKEFVHHGFRSFKIKEMPNLVRCPRPKYLIQTHPEFEVLNELRRALFQDLVEKYFFPPDQIQTNVQIPGCMFGYEADVVIYRDANRWMPYVVIDFFKQSRVLQSPELSDLIRKARLLGAPYVVCCSPEGRVCLDADLWNEDAPEGAIVPIFPDLFFP